MFPELSKSIQRADGDAQMWASTNIFKWMGLRIVEARHDYAKLELDVKDHHRGGGGTAAVNGGVLAYMLDCVIGAAVHSGSPPQVSGQATLSLNIEYLDMAHARDKLVAEAEVIRRGGRTVFADGRIYNDQGRVACRAQGIMRLFQAPAETKTTTGAE